MLNANGYPVCGGKRLSLKTVYMMESQLKKLEKVKDDYSSNLSQSEHTDPEEEFSCAQRARPVDYSSSSSSNEYSYDYDCSDSINDFIDDSPIEEEYKPPIHTPSKFHQGHQPIQHTIDTNTPIKPKPKRTLNAANKWTVPEENTLIEYMLEDSDTPRKWTEATAYLMQRGFTRTPEGCRKKWANIKPNNQPIDEELILKMLGGGYTVQQLALIAKTDETSVRVTLKKYHRKAREEAREDSKEQSY